MKETAGIPVQAMKAHLALNVKNVEASIEFYRAMLGIEPSKTRQFYAKFDVENPPLNLTLNQMPFNEPGALSHLGIQVASTEDVLAIREKWQQAGLEIRDEMEVTCCYALQNKTWVNDPDGNEWEVFVVLEDNLGDAGEGACCVPLRNESTDSASSAKKTTGEPVAAEAEPCCEPSAGCC